MIEPFGDAGLLVEVGSSQRAQALAAALRADPPVGMVEAVPGLASVLLDLDPQLADPDAVATSVRAHLDALTDEPLTGRAHTIPVRYGEADLADVAALTGMSESAVIEAHSAADLRVLFCGFAPGFAYLGDLPPALQVPRLVTPRTVTAAGSVAIAGRMTGIYPADLPGGWRVIGRTDITLFDPLADPPALLVPGDRVRFVPA